jgi:NADH-quinone oxidoreductase subunit H
VFFFLAEYSYIIMMSSLIVVLFFGGWYPPYDWPIFEYVSGFVWFFLKLICILYFIIWVRATLPRYRYDQLMTIGWKVILPLSLGFLFLNIALVTFFLQFV